jgi:hypothetical protein
MPKEVDELEVAVEILGESLSQVRRLIEGAVAANRYSALGRLGEIAEGLTTLRHGSLNLERAPLRDGDINAGRFVADDAAPIVRITADVPRQRVQRRASRDASYPRFERQEERLVKIGWSKRDGAEYEHRAPRTAVDAVASTLLSRHAGPFTMDEVLPLRDAEEVDVPSYQAYMVIAWLRQLHAVERIGNDGYVARHDELTAAAIEAAWRSLPVR